MSNIQLRIADKDPFLYLEANTTGSAVIGIDTTSDNNIVKICTGLVDNIDPTSVAASISIDPAVNGDISFQPKGTTGESVFINGDVSITADSGGGPGTGLGNLNMENTTASGLAGVINFGGDRFVHNYGSENTFIGESAGNFSLNVGSALDNTAVGFNSLSSLTTGTKNVAIGSGALQTVQGVSNTTAVGYHALQALTTGTNNTAVGYQALAASQTNSNNTAVGYNALSSLTTGLRNVAVGTNALAASTVDSNNTAIGYNALASMKNSAVTGNSVAIGQNCLASSVQDYSNIGIGLNALASLNGGGSFSNVAIGIQTLTFLTSGNNNMSMGYQTGYNLLTGSNNVLIGDNSGFNYTGAESNNILFNNLGVLGESNSIHIGTGSTTCFIAGINGVSVTAAGAVVIDSSGKLGTSSILPGTFPFTDETSSPITLAVNNGYTANLGTLLTFNMPATVAYGSVFKILGKGTGLWSVVLSGGQTIKFGAASGTTSIASTLQYDCVEIVCITADTLFEVVNAVGNLTVV